MSKGLDLFKVNQWNLIKDLVNNKVPHQLAISWDYRYGIDEKIVDDVTSGYSLGDIPAILININGGTLEYAKIDDNELFIGTYFLDKVCEFTIKVEDVINVVVGNSICNKGIIENRKEEINRKLKLKLVRRNDNE